MFVDASAIVAILVDEPERHEFALKIGQAGRVITSPISVYETVLGVVRNLKCSLPDAVDEVRDFLGRSESRVVEIDSNIGFVAIEAFQKFGKGRHRAGLNLGDCFAYACAKIHRVPLLCKGDDFIHTDITIA